MGMKEREKGSFTTHMPRMVGAGAQLKAKGRDFIRWPTQMAVVQPLESSPCSRELKEPEGCVLNTGI